MKDTNPLRLVEYPEYPGPTAGIIGQQKTLQMRMKAVFSLIPSLLGLLHGRDYHDEC